MAKNTADTCMFCGETPCACNAPVKKAAPKRKAAQPKVEPVTIEAEVHVEPVQVTVHEPPAPPAAPSMVAQRKALASSKKPISSGPVKPMAQSKQDKKDNTEDAELARALRVFDFYGMLHPTERRKHARHLDQSKLSSETQRILDRAPHRRRG